MTDYQAVVASYLAVWNETDAETRTAMAAKVFTDELAYTDPMMDLRGVPEFTEAVAAAQQMVPGWTVRTVGDVDGHHCQVRFAWEMGPEGEDPAPVTGFDVIALADDGRVSRIFGFFDRMPDDIAEGQPAGSA